MEKSMVHELNSLTHSTIFTNRTSFINTHLGDHDFSQMRKSRIQNLPNHKKEDLSHRLNFVVVFQTIQIQRLSEEIETLRIKQKDYQRQICNYQSYEVQIRELTEKCHMFEMQRQGYEEEIEKMKKFCEGLYRQFEEYKLQYAGEKGFKEKYQSQKSRNEQLSQQADRWRYRLQALEMAKSKQMEEVRMQMESQRKSMLSRQLKEMSLKYESQLGQLASELRKSREDGEWKSQELRRVGELLSRFEVREDEIREIESKMYEYEDRFVMLSQQNYRLNELLRWRNQQIEKMKVSEKELKNRVDLMKGFEVQNGHYKNQLAVKVREMQEIRVRLSRMEEQSEKMMAQSQKSGQYERLLNHSSEEIGRLNNIVHDKIKQIDFLRNVNTILETKLSAMTGATQKQFSAYQQRISSVLKEQQRLSHTLKGRLSQIEGWKTKYLDLQGRQGRLEGVQSEKKRLQQQISIQIRTIEQSKNKIRLLQENMLIMDEIQKKMRVEEQQKRELMVQRQKLNMNIRNLSNQVEMLNQKNVNLQKELSKFSNIQVEIVEYQSQIKSMTQQIERINGEIHRRVAQLQQLREAYKGLNLSKINFQSIEEKLVMNLKQMQSLILQLDETKRQNERYQNEMMNLQSALKRSQSQILNFNQQKYSLTNIINLKTQELGQATRQIEGMSSQLNEMRDISSKYQSLQKRIESVESSYRELEIRYKNESRKSQEYSNQIESLSTQIIQLRSEPKISGKLSQEISILRRQAEQKQELIINLKKRIDNIEGMLGAYKYSIRASYKLGNDLTAQLNKVSQKVEGFNGLVDLLSRYEQKITSLSEENIMLECKSKPVDLEMCESLKVLREEVAPTVAQFTLPPRSPQYQESNYYTFNQITSKEGMVKAPSRVTLDSHPTTKSFINSLDQDTTSQTMQEINKNEGSANYVYENYNRGSFGKNIAVSKIQYVSAVNHNNQSPTYGGYIYSNNGYLITNGQVNHGENDSANKSPQIKTYATSSHGVNEGGLRRTTSNTQLSPSFSNQYKSEQNRDIMPGIRILEPINSQNIARDTNGQSSVKTIRLGSEAKRVYSRLVN